MRETDSQSAPCHVEAEQSVLGGILFNPAAMARAVQHLKTGEEFFVQRHRIIYAAFLELFDNGETIDAMVVIDRLRKSGKLEDAAGADYLFKLMELIATDANVELHAQIVRKNTFYGLRRRSPGK